VRDPFAGLEPVAFWRHFEALTRIPRASYEEERAVAHVIAWAEERTYETRRDAAGNLVVDVPATAGREAAATVTEEVGMAGVAELVPPLITGGVLLTSTARRAPRSRSAAHASARIVDFIAALPSGPLGISADFLASSRPARRSASRKPTEPG
jgi:hypothetical protein